MTSPSERLALAIEKLKELAGDCAECGGTGCITVLDALKPAFGDVIECDSCDDIREVIAACEAP